MNFNTKAVSKIAGLSNRQIDYWDRTHFVKPSVSEVGYGSVRSILSNDLIQMKVKDLLIKGSVSRRYERRSPF
jgi:hypothetical protein